MHELIPVYSPELTPEDAAAVQAAVLAGSVSGTSPTVARFERAFASWCGASAGAAASSGTTALELALIALRIGPDDEVICPSLTIASCARAIASVRATPVFVDVDADSFVLDVDAVLARITPRTRAVLAVHLFGHPVDLARLLPLRDEGVHLVEDAAQAIGSEVRIGRELRRCGSVGDAAAFSFYANKAITTGEGGMVLGRDVALVERAREAANLFFGRAQRFRHEELGHNYRMSGIQAALGLSQLARIDAVLAKKRAVERRYRDALADVRDIRFPVTKPWAEPVPWMAAVVVDGLDEELVRRRLAERGIEARPFFLGLHEQPALARLGLTRGERLPVTEHLARHGLYLPSSPSLTDAQIERVCDALRDALGRSRRARTPAPFGPHYAALYDAFYADKPYAEEARALCAALERFEGGEVRRVLDLGCGTGRHARELAAAGLSVTAVDRSAAMLSQASVDGVRFVEADLRHLTLSDERPFDAAVMMFAVLGYQLDDDSLARCLAGARAHLREGALLVADFWWAPAVRVEPPAERSLTVVTERGERIERRATPTHHAAQKRVDVHYLVRDARGHILADEIHGVRYFDRAELESALDAAGFDLVHVGGWPDFDAPPGVGSYSACLIARAR